MIININGKSLKITNQIPEYEDLIEWRFLSFNRIDEEKNINSFLEITPKYTKIKIENRQYYISGKLLRTDIYTILNAVVSIILSDEDNAYIHSSVLSKNKKGILLLGTFSQGKTTLALEMEKNGFNINSADYTHLYFDGKRLKMKSGSRHLKYEDKIRLLDEANSNLNIEIKEVYILLGICDGGIFKKEKVTDENYMVKKIFPFLTWWTNAPLISDPNIILQNTKYKEMFGFLKKFNKIPLFNLRGDKKVISLNLSKTLER